MPPGYYGANTDVERSVPDLDTFLDDLSSPAPVPGGGSAAALSAAMGAALLAMVCNLTIGRKRYADVQAEGDPSPVATLKLRPSTAWVVP